MAEFLEAECTVVLGGVTLLELGVDYMREETNLEQEQLVQPVSAIRASFEKRIGRQNVRHTFSWDRVKRFATAAEARLFKWSHAAALPTAAGDCTLTYPSGAVVTLADAILEGDRYNATTNAQLFFARYRITCAGLTITNP